MSIKLIGAALLVGGFGYTGQILVTHRKKTTKLMQQLIASFSFMECELSYRLTPLPDLLRRAADGSAILQQFYSTLASELEGQISPNVSCCVDAALAAVPELPDIIKNGLIRFGKNVGRFDLDGQIRGIATVREECVAILSTYTHDQDTKLRNYRALALCAGVMVAILLF